MVTCQPLIVCTRNKLDGYEIYNLESYHTNSTDPDTDDEDERGQSGPGQGGVQCAQQ